MKPNAPSPDDSGQRTDPAIAPHQLAKIERQLRRARPRPPELDIEAIVRSAETADQPVVLTERSRRTHARQTVRRIGMVAGSWACGAMVGASVTFMLLSRGGLRETSPDGIATLRNDTPTVVQEDAGGTDRERTGRDDSLRSELPWSRTESHVLAMLLDQYSVSGTQYAEEWHPLRAGMLALRRDLEGSWRIRQATGSVPPDWIDAPEPNNDAQQNNTTHSVPARATTRDKLLQELLGLRSESVL